MLEQGTDGSCYQSEAMECFTGCMGGLSRSQAREVYPEEQPNPDSGGQMKVGDLVDINQKRGTGSFEKITPRGLGVVMSFQELEDLHYENIGSINLGPIVHVLLNTGEAEGFSPQSLEVVCESRR